MTTFIQVWGREGDDWDYDEDTCKGDYSHEEVLDFLANRFGGTKFKINSVKVNGKPFDMEKNNEN